MSSRVVSACCVLLLAGCALPSREVAPPDGSPAAAPAATASTYVAPVAPDQDAGHTALWYIPNRISDLFDIVRARLRLGPGIALGGRFTDSAMFNWGGYSSVFIGIPGPRLERRFNWPVGVEVQRGDVFSPFDGTAWGGEAPTYGHLEVGLGTQLLLVGADLGLDVYELLDFFTGIVTIDPIGDDV